MRIFLIAIFCLFQTSSSFADVYIKSKTMSGDSETWISGNKQRVDVDVPMAGKIITITRVDRGIEWQLDMKNGIYEEKPIAVPLTKEETDTQHDTTGAGSQLEKDLPMPNAPGGVGSLQALPQKREFMGASATGYQWVPDDSGSVFWMLPLKGDFAKAEKEQQGYQKTYLNALYANSSAKDREEMVKAMQMPGVMIGRTSPGMIGTPGLPEGFSVGLETMVGSAQSDQPHRMMVFEMTELNLDRLDGSVFELPQGMRRVNDLAEEQARLMMGPGYDATMQSMQQIPQAAQQGGELAEQPLAQEEPTE